MKTTIISLVLFICPLINWSSTNACQNINEKNAPQSTVTITAADIALAKEVIQSNTMTLPGFTPGSQVKVSPGNFSAADALVLYLLKFHYQTKICPPIAVVAEALKKLNDADVHKKAVSIFWLEYSTCSNLNEHISRPDALRSDFGWYVLTKQTERLKISNARLACYVGTDEAWRHAMNSQQQSWEKSRAREDEYLLKRESYRAVFDAQAAVAAAEQVVAREY